MPTHIHIVAKIPKKQWDQGGEAMGRNEMKKWIVVINRKGQGPWKTDPDQSHHSLGFLVDWGCQSTWMQGHADAMMKDARKSLGLEEKVIQTPLFSRSVTSQLA
jgi:hypothetical protein